MYVYMRIRMCPFISLLHQLREPERNTTVGAMDALAAWYLISFFQQKESRILGKMVCSRSGSGKLQISLELLVPDNKKVPK